MYKTLRGKVSKFAALHPRLMMLGIGIGTTLGIALALGIANPHYAKACWDC